MESSIPHPVESILPLTVERLSFSVGEADVLVDLSFTIERGTRNIVLGPNGAGKSVLLRALHGLLAPTSGRIRWTLADGLCVRQAQSMVFQRPVMLRRTALDNVRFALAIRAERAATVAIHDLDIDASAMRALDHVGLAALAARPARLCSIGEQQRIALARAWALAPEVLFLDEPTASLDPAATRAVEDVIGAMHAAGTTIVMTTHDLGQARRLADRVLFLHRGRLLEDAAAASFFAQPRSPEAAAFINGDLLW